MKSTSVLSFLTALILTANAAYAQVGNSGFALLKLGVSGRTAGMGEAATASVSGAAATFYNPSGLRTNSESSSHIMLMHREWIQDARTQFLGATVNLTDRSAIGLSVNHSTVADIEIRTRPGLPQGTFTARNFVLGVSYAHQISPDIRVGLTGKFLFEKILIDEASGIGFDFGAQWDAPVDNLKLGIAFANLGGVNELRQESTSLPALVRTGVAYEFDLAEFTSAITVAADLLHIFPEKKSYVNLGAEVLLSNIVGIRGGYQLGSSGRGLSAGLGIRHGIVGVDYGFTPLSFDLGKSHTVSISISL